MAHTPSEHVSPLDSPAIGTGRNDLITPCRSGERWPANSPAVTDEIAVAMSGGGFRATLAALGTLRLLGDAGLLEQVRYSSSVSGGSISNGLFATRWEQLAKDGFSGEAVDEHLIGPFVRRITSESLKAKLLRNVWRILGRTTRTDVLANAFDEWFFGGFRLEDLTPDCRFVFNAANLTTGVRFTFERQVVGDYVLGLVPTAGTGLRVAQAAASSAAVPGAFAAMELPDLALPCAEGRRPLLVDGGAYDNMGLQALENLMPPVCLVAINAGGTFQTGGFGKVPIVRDLQRSNGLLYRQTTALRMNELVERFQAWEQSRTAGAPPPPWGRRGVVAGLASTVTGVPPAWLAGRPEVPPWVPAGTDVEDWRRSVAFIATSFDQFPEAHARDLLYRGWWLTGATLATYHPDLVPEPYPPWRSLP
jgi:NTE family protein